MVIFLRGFHRNESGAITVDWVVLTAALVGMALGVAVSQLPARQREAIRLLRLSELSLCEAAAMSDQSIGSLKVACHRALKSLKRALDGKDLSHE